MGAREINVWAYHADFGTLCRYGGLDNEKGLSYPDGNEQGQAGWHVTIRFESLLDLAKQLENGVPMPSKFCGRYFRDCDAIQRGEISRLALMAHGDQGGVWAPNGLSRGPKITPDNVSSYHAQLNSIGLYTNEQSTILLTGCLSAQGRPGTMLLSSLSQVWTHRVVVGYTTIGYRHAGAMKRPGEACELPGMRETDAHSEFEAHGSNSGPPVWDSQWRDFKKLPWTSTQTPHVKVVKDGAILRCPNDELCSDTPPRSKQAPIQTHKLPKRHRR